MEVVLGDTKEDGAPPLQLLQRYSGISGCENLTLVPQGPSRSGSPWRRVASFADHGRAQ